MPPCDPWVEPLELPAKLRVVRARWGLSISAAAERCGINDATWGKWEKTTSPRDFTVQMKKISVGLGVDYDWLVAEPISDMWPYHYSQLALYLDDGQADETGEPWKTFPSSTRTGTRNEPADSPPPRSAATESFTPRSPDGSRVAA